MVGMENAIYDASGRLQFQQRFGVDVVVVADTADVVRRVGFIVDQWVWSTSWIFLPTAYKFIEISSDLLQFQTIFICLHAAVPVVAVVGCSVVVVVGVVGVVGVVVVGIVVVLVVVALVAPVSSGRQSWNRWRLLNSLSATTSTWNDECISWSNVWQWRTTRSSSGSCDSIGLIWGLLTAG